MGINESFNGLVIIQIIFCIVFVSAVNSVTLNCQQIRRELSSWMPASRNSLSKAPNYFTKPTTPFHDPKMRICYQGNSKKNQSSCCSAEIENDYLQQGNQQIRKWISFRNFRKILIARRTSIEKEELQFRKIAALYVINNLSVQFRISTESLRRIVINFFTQLLSNHTRPTEEEIVDNFIIDVSPLIYYHFIKRGDQVGFGERKHKCLANSFKKHRKDSFAPQKGGNMMVLLKRTKAAFQRLKSSIRLLLSVVRQLGSVSYPEQCLKAMARNHLCPRCFGTANSSSVCLKTCQNVFHGCHVHWTQLESYWDRFVDGVRRLSKMMIDRLKIESALRNVIDYAFRKFSETVVSELKHLDAKLLDDCFVAGYVIKPVARPQISAQKTPKFAAVNLNTFLKDLHNFLESKLKFFTKLVRKPCLKLPQFSCWNGTHLSDSGYLKPVPKFLFAAQENNPEVTGQSPEQIRVVSHLQRELNGRYMEMVREARRRTGTYNKFKMKSKKRKKQRKYRKRGRIEGSGFIKEGSGNGANNPPDDERDEFTTSGSGDTKSLFAAESSTIKRVDRIDHSLATQRERRERLRPQTTSAALISKFGGRKADYNPSYATPRPVMASRNSSTSPLSFIGLSIFTLFIMLTVAS